MPIEHPSNWDKIYASSILSIPVMLMAAFASFAYIWTIDDPAINTKRAVGSVLLAMVVAWIILQYGPWFFPGIPIEVMNATAVLFGIFGQKSIEWLAIKIRSSIK